MGFWMKIENGTLKTEWDGQAMRLFVDGKKIEPSVRKLGDMMEVLYDRDYANGADKGRELYYMHREQGRPADSAKFAQYDRRYDITVLPPARLGKEFTKTVGHYHELSGASGHKSFPELYEVLHGTAHFLMFRRKISGGVDEDDCIDDAVLLEVRAGEKAYMPPNYGHIMINPTSEVLVTDNIVQRTFKSIYEPVGKMKGGPYFELVDGSAVPNPRFESLAPLRKVRATSHEETLALGLDAKKPIYDLFLESPEKFGFLQP